MSDTIARGINQPDHVPESSYGIDPATGIFRHPTAAPYAQGPKPVKGSLDYFETKQYISNMTIERHWPKLVLPGVTFQNILDMNGRRILYHYYRSRVNVYDITDPKNLQVLLEKRYADDEGFFGAAAIAYNKRLQKWIMIQSFEVPRSGPMGLGGAKHTDPAKVAKVKGAPGFRGIRIFEIISPAEWKQIGEISTDPLHRHGKVQEGSGALDIPTYYGGKYALVAAAPDNTFIHQEYPSYLYSPGQMVFDVEDPVNPQLVSTWWVPGQRLGEEEAYRRWRQYENRTSWTGARMPMVLERPLEEGGRYAYAVMGGLGFHVLDLADPDNIKTVASIDLPLNVGGIEGDNVDASRAATRGIVMVNGYPMNEDGYEPYKDIFVIDVRDKTKPTIIGTLPRPRPPEDAPYSDFVLRRGRFGPKRAGYYCQPGTPHPNVTIYPFINGGVQLFDITDPIHAKIAAYFVPPMTDGTEKGADTYKSPMECIAIEWDRNLIWCFGNTGLYLLSSPALGTPNLGAPGA
jgi:hypothetical protein